MAPRGPKFVRMFMLDLCCQCQDYARSIQSTTQGTGHPTLAHSNNFCTILLSYSNRSI